VGEIKSKEMTRLPIIPLSLLRPGAKLCSMYPVEEKEHSMRKTAHSMFMHEAVVRETPPSKQNPGKAEINSPQLASMDEPR
jgi:hypothetical protein